MYPSLKDPEHANVRLKNVGRQVYLCVTQDDTGNPVLGTKTLSEPVDPDGEYWINSRIPFRWLCSGCAKTWIKCRTTTCHISIKAPPPQPRFCATSLSAMKVYEQEFPIVQYLDSLPQISLKNERCHVRSCDCTDTQQYCSISSNIPGVTTYRAGPSGRTV